MRHHFHIEKVGYYSLRRPRVSQRARKRVIELTRQTWWLVPFGLFVVGAMFFYFGVSND